MADTKGSLWVATKVAQKADEKARLSAASKELLRAVHWADAWAAKTVGRSAGEKAAWSAEKLADNWAA
jgi:hypothetical protein